MLPNSASSPLVFDRIASVRFLMGSPRSPAVNMVTSSESGTSITEEMFRLVPKIVQAQAPGSSEAEMLTVARQVKAKSCWFAGWKPRA